MTDARAVLAQTSTEALLGALRVLDAPDLTEEGRMVRAWTCDELERRHPHLAPVLDAFATDLDERRTYARVLLDALAP